MVDLSKISTAEMLATLQHPEGWHERRRQSLGASDAKYVMEGNWLELWESKTGRKPPEDLSGVLPVIMGSWSEPLNKYYFELQTGLTVTDAGKSVKHPQYSFMHATLDGLVGDAVFEAKHVNAFSKIEEVVERYTPQLTHQMIVTGLDRAVLSVFIGTMKYEAVDIELDSGYAIELLTREQEFWKHVENDTQPEDKDAVQAPVEAVKEVDMDGNNEWSVFAAEWVENKVAASTFDKAVKTIKGLVPEDAVRAFGYGIEAKRSKNNAIRIGVMK